MIKTTSKSSLSFSLSLLLQQFFQLIGDEIKRVEILLFRRVVNLKAIHDGFSAVGKEQIFRFGQNEFETRTIFPIVNNLKNIHLIITAEQIVSHLN